MKNSTISKLIVVFSLVFLVSYIVVNGDYFSVDSKFLAARTLGLSFGAVPVLLWLKLVSSSFALEVFSSSMSLRDLEMVYLLSYPFLTKEARAAWKEKMDYKKSLQRD